MEVPWLLKGSAQYGKSMKKLFLPIVFGLLLPTAALAQLQPEVADQCKEARDFYGCVRAVTSPPQSKVDRASLAGVMGQVAAGLISGPILQNRPTNLSRGLNPAGLLEGIVRGVLR